MDKFVFHNGKRITLSQAVKTVGEARPHLGAKPDDVIMRVHDSRAKALADSDELKSGDNLASHPRVTKGAGTPAPSSWVQRDLALLRQTIGRRHAVETKAVTRSGQPYLAVEIRDVRLNTDKFATTVANLLFMLPASYPAMPPIGVYIHYPFARKDVADHHLTLRGYYGAPDLQGAGYYWYCLRPHQPGQWRPAVNPEDGHNLIALYNAARYAINN